MVPNRRKFRVQDSIDRTAGVTLCSSFAVFRSILIISDNRSLNARATQFEGAPPFLRNLRFLLWSRAPDSLRVVRIPPDFRYKIRSSLVFLPRAQCAILPGGTGTRISSAPCASLPQPRRFPSAQAE